MIWLWIALSVAVTALLLRKKNIAPHNFLWALMPIDKYGIDFLGFTLKPIYIFSILLIAYSVITKSFRLKLSRPVLYFTSALGILILLSLLLRGNVSIIEDLKIYGMLFFTIVLAACTMSFIEGRDDLRQIRDVMIATAVGYGIVFLSLYFLDSIGITLSDVKSLEVWDNSIIKIFHNSVNGKISYSSRLRGFYIDPNAACVFFLVGFANLLGDWIKKGNTVKNIIFSVIITLNIILTSSRSALVIWILIIVLSVFRLFFSQMQSRRKIIFLGVTLVVLFFGSVAVIYNSKMFSYVYDSLILGYMNRASLNDELGRITIWSDSLASLNSSNWYCGLGIGSIAELIDANRDAHNTIIEVICSSGVFAGGAYTLYFLYPLLFAFKRRIVDSKNALYLSNFAIAYLGVYLMLLTISNITSVYLVYTAFLLFVIPGCLENEDHLRSEHIPWRKDHE